MDLKYTELFNTVTSVKRLFWIKADRPVQFIESRCLSELQPVMKGLQAHDAAGVVLHMCQGKKYSEVLICIQSCRIYI